MSMSIRTVCFIAIIFVDGWLQWAFVAGAVVLPYLAVIAANAGGGRDRFAHEVVTPTSHNALPEWESRIITVDRPGPDQP